MFRRDHVDLGQRGDRRRDSKYLGTASAGKRQPVDGPVEQGPGTRRKRRRRSKTLARAAHAFEHGRRRFAGLSAELGRGRAWQREDEVEAVEQGPRQTLAIAGERLRRATAVETRIAACAAGAEVHRPCQLKSRREENAAVDAGDGDHAVLERLPERLERRPRELGQLVEQ